MQSPSQCRMASALLGIILFATLGCQSGDGSAADASMGGSCVMPTQPAGAACGPEAGSRCSYEEEAWTMMTRRRTQSAMNVKRTGSHTLQDFQAGWNSSKCVGPSVPRRKKVSPLSVRGSRWLKTLSKTSIRSRRRLVGFVRPGIKLPPNAMDDDEMDIFCLERGRTRIQWCVQDGERARPSVEESRSHEAHKSGARMSLCPLEGKRGSGLRKEKESVQEEIRRRSQYERCGSQNLKCTQGESHLNNSRWNSMLQALVDFKRKFGHTRPAADQPALCQWVKRQRVAQNSGKLRQCRMQKLQDIGFCWDSRELSWEVRFKELVFFCQRYGHCNVPKKYAAHPQLGNWLSLQREKLRTGRLDQERLELLQELGVVWEVFEQEWDKYLREIEKYIKTTGNNIVPAVPGDGLDDSLCHWASLQRLRFRKGTLPFDREQRMRAVGFEFDFLDDRWQARLDRVSQAIQSGGTEWWTKIAEGKKLRQWLKLQRLLKERGKLTPRRTAALVELNWNDDLQFPAVKRFKSRPGSKRRREGKPLIIDSVIFRRIAPIHRPTSKLTIQVTEKGANRAKRNMQSLLTEEISTG